MVVLSTICPLVGNLTGFSISVPIIGSHNSSGGSSSKSFSISAKDSSRGMIASRNRVPFYGFYQSSPNWIIIRAILWALRIESLRSIFKTAVFPDRLFSAEVNISNKSIPNVSGYQGPSTPVRAGTKWIQWGMVLGY